ncbi:MAG: c-type cytochrome domain-containing protein [Bacteroidota bacterium]
MVQFKNTLAQIVFGTIAFSLALTTGSCKKDDGPIGPDGSPSDVVFPSSNISYSQHVQPLFNQTCALVGCHSQGESADRLKLDTYENLRFGVRGLPVVIAGSPETSELVFRIEGRTGQRMPLNRNPLNQNQINGIRAWIAEGAKRN